VSACTEEDPCAQVEANLFTCYCKVDLHADCMIARRKSSPGGPSKAAEQQLAIEQIISSVATTSAPPPVGGTYLMVCSNAEVRHSTQRIVQYRENLKDVEADREGTLLPPLFQTSVLTF
jgi:hypothetical protein